METEVSALLLRTSSLARLPQAKPYVSALLICAQPQQGVSTKIGDIETISGDPVDLCQELPGHATCLLLSRQGTQMKHSNPGCRTMQ